MWLLSFVVTCDCVCNERGPFNTHTQTACHIYDRCILFPKRNGTVRRGAVAPIYRIDRFRRGHTRNPHRNSKSQTELRERHKQHATDVCPATGDPQPRSRTITTIPTTAIRRRDAQWSESHRDQLIHHTPHPRSSASAPKPCLRFPASPAPQTRAASRLPPLLMRRPPSLITRSSWHAPVRYLAQ